MSKAVIVSYARTPIGKLRGGLCHLTAPQLGAAAITGALSRLEAAPKIAEAYMGNVLSAGIGQAPCRQAVLGAGLPESTICNTINKVCASGMKSIMLAAQTIESNTHGSGSNDGSPIAMLAGGMESMSNTPHYLPTSRSGTALGHAKLIDGIIHDGLWDPYDNVHMGTCAEKCATEYSISREDQDRYAIESYKRAREAMNLGVFDDEIVPVEGPKKRGKSKDDPPDMLCTDEEPNAANLDKLPSLRAAFEKEGTVTAGNASSINDGASAVVIMDEDQAIAMGLKPLARIRGYADAEGLPVQFTTAPSNAIPIAVDRAGMTMQDVEYHEINEAFSVVALANSMILNLDMAKVNIFGGAVSLGHPIGMSGARIVGSLYQVLKRSDATMGCASICNGGGGASAIVLERLN
mmetsp:Transcript_34395/g.83195  ORF Transcript_34395/g.83195 Transcript_34395/m.83195 type:complete len:407 (+) Transcript_34395:66-1286(+)